ncbi:prepilin peptidase [Vibrio rumoiensis]|uniref:Prepilin leader peptidase/N-methyltransferase n=1 Tax=Vibrio rumoiensis 1S-45 TaxID=1188252 RepID=A0A1E5E1J2_9VIBR|nr:A24 family peptidase [Vibrio rumoiensis]OEF24966.1 methyltransferase [Vibrio rumoiensis 1S-45]
MIIFEYYPFLFAIFAGIFGLMIGSFLNVVIHRLPMMMEREWKQECIEFFPQLKKDPEIKKELESLNTPFNLNTPRSRCPKCNTQIRAIDNIPVISWLILKGKCHKCANPISARYPAIELLTSALCVVIGLYFPADWYGVALLFFTFTLVSATFIDLDTMLLPDQLTLPLMWAGLALSLLNISPVSLQDAVIGAIAGYLCLWTIFWAFKLLTSKEGMGYGDFKLLAALGAWLGWQQLPLLILMSSLVGLAFGLIQLRLQKKGIDKAFPFGPYLAIAGWFCLIWGNDLTSWYLNNMLGM